ncbi:MAG: DUF3480 domain-containing protein [Polyangiaceae bacterium]|nr:DUF3480 domain-containing protein [Polyangiaceae bacterium]
MAPNGEIDQVQLLDGSATVRLYAHEIASEGGERVLCWSYVTEGLGRYGQREIVLTLRRAPGEELPPGDGLGLLELVARSAKEGSLVDRGGISGFGPRGFLANPSLRGLVYASAQRLAGVVIPDGALTAVCLFGDEFEAVRRYGPLRVLARLGQATKYYPFPPWSERAREPVAGALESILDKVAALPMPNAAVSIEADQIVLRLAPACAPLFAEALSSLPPTMVLTLHPSLASDAAACLVWTPGQTAPSAISLPTFDGSRLGACFVGFVPQQAAEEARLFEDGVMLMLPNAAWAELRAALVAGKPYRFEKGEGERAFCLEWRSPVETPVGPMRVVLLTPEAKIRATIETGVLAAYMNELEAAVRETVGSLPATPGCDLVVEAALAPSRRPTLTLASNPLEPPAALRALLPPRLEAVGGPDVRSEIRFQLLFQLWGGAPGGALPDGSVGAG